MFREMLRRVLATGVLTVSVSAPSKGYNGIAISVSASWDSGAVGPYEGLISWGDGSAADYISQSTKSITKTHTYTANGTYTITVIISDEGTGAYGTGTASITIAAPPPLPACPMWINTIHAFAVKYGLKRIQQELETLAESKKCSLT